ncbi:MAG: response regulator [Thermodesulfobacteriota bacterium]|nr:response regulator [Thermodesulfobacteriota bacterium]
MSVITIFSGAYCQEEPLVRKVLSDTGYKLVADADIVALAGKTSNMAARKIEKAFSAKTSAFNNFTHEKERSIAHLRLALAEILAGDNLLIAGFTGQLIPKEIRHVLRVCLIADMRFRTAQAAGQDGLSEKEALKVIHKSDNDRVQWVNTLSGNQDPWDSALYDIVIPMDKMSVEDGEALIIENLGKDVVNPTAGSKKAVEDFLLAAMVEVALAGEGHDVGVSARQGAVTLIINKHVLMLGRLEEELKSIVGQVPGVNSVETKVGTGFYQADVYRKYDFEMPSKVLLVDDEREFVQTLSERLLLRDMGSTVAFDGESALDLIDEDEPEVMILDLRMPGIDGIEVLKRVKQTHPEIEVIILTGHGSEADREQCMELGAFAYLQKPQNIDDLSDVLKKANEKMRLNLAAKNKSDQG